ncbi:NAD(P)H-dependent glycerol-3-phosphate dehydrogenase [Litorivivens sp.]|uniref:NAD(P)H-dependent glycerol-3-phosphate dehydrogenase n=3 Tax=Litorivivens sp. TaxID=2020868 RepID=UPI0035682AA2
MSEKLYRVAVLGGGSFGTAIANIVADNGHPVHLWLRSEERALEINEKHENEAYLPGIALNPALRATTDLATAVESADIVFVAVPSKSCREVCRTLAGLLSDNCILVSTTKGIEADGFKLMSQVIHEEIPNARLGVMSGPNLAKELADRQITATVIASQDTEVTEAIQTLLQCSYFRVYAGEDTYGLELCGALKNVYAICSGIAAAMGVGSNTQGVLLTRSLAEMCRFAVNKGADPMTFMGLAGVGDLFVTCTSPLSRNYRVGFALGQGKDLNAVVAELGQVAEGVNTLRLLKDQAEQLGVYMPLASGLYDIIYNEKSLDDVVANMMSADQTRDVDFSLR